MLAVEVQYLRVLSIFEGGRGGSPNPFLGKTQTNVTLDFTHEWDDKSPPVRGCDGGGEVSEDGDVDGDEQGEGDDAHHQAVDAGHEDYFDCLR